MSKKMISFLALTLSIVLLLCACQNVVPEDLDVPTFKDDQSMVIGTWTGSMTNWTSQQFAYLQEANINLLVGVSEWSKYTDNFFRMAESAGIKVIPDSRSWNGQTPSYMEDPVFAGYCVWDEPDYTDFDALAEKKALWDETMGDKMFFVNLFPSYATSALGGSFKRYVRDYLEKVQPEVLCFDHYPLIVDNTGKTTVRDTFFSDMDVCSHYAKEAGVPFWSCLLSAGHMDYVTPNTREIGWQMAVAQAYGATGVLHYAYASHDPDYTAPIDWATQTTTEVYEAMKAADAELAAWDHIYMRYNWQGTATVNGSSNPYGSVGFQLCQFSVDPTDGTGITAIKSDEDLLCGIFKDNSGKKAYMLTNATNPAEGKDTTVKLTLGKDYKGVLVIDCGKQTVLTLENGTASIEVGSGKGVFVIPLTTK